MSNDSTHKVSVRPYGHVRENPVVHRIGSRALFVGNRAAGEQADRNADVESVLSLTVDALETTSHHRPLVDGPDNDWTSFEAAAETARVLHDDEDPLLVHCKAGISWSVTVAATAIAVAESRSFADALDEVMDAHPDAVPHPALHEQAVYYLASRG
jgi:predicted protein tyrosine phosphatase